MIKTILVDDEKHAIKNLERLLIKYENIEIVEGFTNINEAFEAIKKINIDLVFLDIEMPNMNGIEAAEKIFKINHEVQIVFVTAYNHYAVEAFEVDAVDYIMKPVLKRRLDKTIERIIKRYSNTIQEKIEKINNKIICFKSFRWIHNGEIIKWRTSKTKELIAYFIHNKGKFVHKDKIIETLWPDKHEKQATTILHTSVYYIRKTLKTMGIDKAITYADEMYKLNLAEIYCDIDDFNRIINDKRSIDSENIKIFEKAVELYVGDYFEENDFIWARNEQERISKKYENILKQMANFYMKQKKYNKTIEYLKKILEKEPFIEEIHKNLLKVYIYMEDYKAFDHHHKQMIDSYKHELGIALNISKKELYDNYI